MTFYVTADHDLIAELLRQRLSWKEIAARAGCGLSTVRRVANARGLRGTSGTRNGEGVIPKPCSKCGQPLPCK